MLEWMGRSPDTEEELRSRQLLWVQELCYGKALLYLCLRIWVTQQEGRGKGKIHGSLVQQLLCSQKMLKLLKIVLVTIVTVVFADGNVVVRFSYFGGDSRGECHHRVPSCLSVVTQGLTCFPRTASKRQSWSLCSSAVDLERSLFFSKCKNKWFLINDQQSKVSVRIAAK